MNWELVLTRAVFAELCRRLAENPSRVSVCPSGLARLPDRHTVLVSALEFRNGARRGEANLVAVGAASEAELLARLRAAILRPPVDTPAVFLALGTGDVAGACVGQALSWRGPEPLGAVRVIAEGLPVVRLIPSQDQYEPDSEGNEIWSRTIGALSPPVWRRLTELKPAIVGCGRSGSLLAGALIRSGVQAATVIDSDRLELGNCGEMDLVNVADVGRSKSQAIADALRSLALADSEISDVLGGATSLPALLAAKDAHFLFGCVDNGAARLAITLLAQLYLKPMLDIGTGVMETASQGRNVGFDIRLLLPGRCLSCFGGLRLTESAAGMQNPQSIETDWRLQRLGSLRSLNMAAVGMGLRLVEDFLAGIIRESTWLSADYEDGVPRVVAPSVAPVANCPICALAGLGDAGLEEVPGLLERLERGESRSGGAPTMGSGGSGATAQLWAP